MNKHLVRKLEDGVLSEPFLVDKVKGGRAGETFFTIEQMTASRKALAKFMYYIDKEPDYNPDTHYLSSPTVSLDSKYVQYETIPFSEIELQVKNLDWIKDEEISNKCYKPEDYLFKLQFSIDYYENDPKLQKLADSWFNRGVQNVCGEDYEVFMTQLKTEDLFELDEETNIVKSNVDGVLVSQISSDLELESGRFFTYIRKKTNDEL